MRDDFAAASADEAWQFNKPRAAVDVSLSLLNDLLSEQSHLVEIYHRAIASLDNPSAELAEITEDHRRATIALQDRIAELGEAPAMPPAPCAAPHATPSPIDLLHTLRQSEHRLIAHLRAGLKTIDASSADLLANQLAPAVQRHLTVLNALIARQHSPSAQ